MRKTVRILMSCALILCLAACGGGEEPAPAPEPEPEPVPEPVATELILVKEPDKSEYVEGETFDPTGMVVNAKLEDGSLQENVPFTVVTRTPLKSNSKRVTITYGGKTIQVSVSVILRGRLPEYRLENTEFVPGSPLEGKTILWLGSSVTFGEHSDQESMADYIAKKDGALCIKEAVSGTTLSNTSNASYVARLEDLIASDRCPERLDAFVCQLSTNDKKAPENYGTVTGPETFDPAAFDQTTTFGAMEYIIAVVRDTWSCPVFFYTNPPMDDDNYGLMVDALEQIAAKWGVTIIDMYRDEAFNRITDDQRALYMADSIHPTNAGYRDWWLPKFEKALEGI